MGKHTRGFKYKFNLHKSYFDKGYSLLNMLRYVIFLYGLDTIMTGISSVYAISLFLSYFIICYVVGWVWYNKGWQIAEAEVGNQYNYFVKEMRNSYPVKRKTYKV